MNSFFYLSLEISQKNAFARSVTLNRFEHNEFITELFNIQYNGKWATSSAESGSVGTYGL